MKKEEFDKLLSKYLEGNCNKEEEEWLDQFFRLANAENNPGVSDQHLDGVENKLWKQIHTSTVELQKDADPEEVLLADSEPARNYAFIWGMAASIALLIGCFILFKLASQRAEPNGLTFNAPGTIAFENKSAETKHIDLPDGSSLWLAPGSKIRYPQQFPESNRDIYLGGKAFFDVVSDTTRPFRIFGDKLVVKVLGTSFGVDYNSKTDDAQVQVRTGKVTVIALKDLPVVEKEGFTREKEKAPIVLLKANEQAIINTNSKTAKKTELKPGFWEKEVEGSNFIFRNAPLPEVIAQLENSYKISIQVINPQLNNCTITANLEGQPLLQKIEIISRSINAKFKIEKEQYILRGPGCKGK